MENKNELAKLEAKDINWNDLESYELTKKGKQDLRNFMLNQSPTDKWLKTHPLYKNTYLPIDKVEFLLTIFFQNWRVEVKSFIQIANSICVSIRLYYKNPDSDEFDYQDGVGAAPMQVNSGSNAMDHSAIKSNAVMLALPIAETNAVKDAADKIGKIFGRDLNRKDTMNYDLLAINFDDATLIEK
jgi:hypothetical protein